MMKSAADAARVTAAGLLLLAVAGLHYIDAFAGDQSEDRVHHHLTGAVYDENCGCGKTELCSHLPLVIIDTKEQAIPGSITGRTDRYGESIYTTAADGQTTIQVEISVMDNEDGNNHPSDIAAFTAQADLRVRGHASRSFEKASYLVKFVEEDGTDRDISVMGMDAHNEWVLNGPFLDKTLMRNYMWYNISGEMMDYAPDVRYCEVILNGDYRGIYLMVESITNGKEGRLKLQDNVKNTELTGYLLRADRTVEEEVEGIRDIYSYLERMDIFQGDISIRYPGKNKLTESVKRQIEEDFSLFEKTLYSFDYDGEEYGWQNWIDADNFMDYLLINEYAGNADAGRYSTYLYREAGEKLKLCVWDFNNACGNFPDDLVGPESFKMYDSLWYFMLFKDEAFVEQAIERYWQLRKTYFSDEYLSQYMDETIAWLEPAAERNNLRWEAYYEEWKPLKPEERNPENMDEALEQMKDWLYKRGEWMDENIDTWRQYSHPSRNKLYNH